MKIYEGKKTANAAPSELWTWIEFLSGKDDTAFGPLRAIES